eukprot:TRINITY_DN33119_c0_g1_i1.p1 TRINITY_DN33119_c0_g1~~TRINITY_DN33119_c0_g1_i1.p1  ORF type:complete len:436 (+),score=170.55 TRINITY_DN33119_c0_g1_i1:56-1309(+)
MVDAEQPLMSDTGGSGLQLSMLQVKLRYGFIMMLAFVVALVFRAVPKASEGFTEIKAMSDPCKGDSTDFCLASTFVMRLSFSLFLFYAMHLVMSLRWMRVCFGDHAFGFLIVGGFVCKIFFLAVMVVISLFLPFDFFVGFGYFAMVCSIFFLIIQGIILLDFAYSWNEKWVPTDGWGGSDEDETLFKRATIIATFLLFTTGCVLCGLCYKWFAPDTCTGSDKSLNLFFITFTLVFGVLSTLGSAAIDGGSILISSFAFAYCALMTFSALNSGATGEDCDQIWTDPTKVSFNTILSMGIAAVAVVHASVSTSSQRSAFSVNSIDYSEDDDQGATFPFFFLSFALGSCYLAMTLCSWDIMRGSDDLPENHDYLAADMSSYSMWIKMSTVWFTMILFVWALVAPSLCGPEGFCCRDRTFD